MPSQSATVAASVAATHDAPGKSLQPKSVAQEREQVPQRHELPPQSASETHARSQFVCVPVFGSPPG
jgi:hypothetical protein